jgi:ABC-type protease/lipase transport system fused ATPase/permease subunit
VRARGGIVVVVAHRPSAIAGVDQLLVLQGGRKQAYGPKDTVLREALKPVAPAAVRPTPVQATMGFAAPARPGGRSQP